MRGGMRQVPRVAGIRQAFDYLGTHAGLRSLGRPLARAGVAANDYLVYRDDAASGTTGPTYTADTWNTVLLDTEVTDTAGIGSLAANAITLAAGSYEFHAFVNPGYYAAGNASMRLRLHNTADVSTVGAGVNVNQPGSGYFMSTLAVVGQFVITAQKTFELQVYPTDATTAAAAVTSGDVETYALIMLRRYKR